MILRSAILGLVLSIVVILGLIFYPQRTTDPFLEELKELSMSGDEIPPKLFPMFPWDDDQPEKIISMPIDLIRIHKDPQSREVSIGNSVNFRIQIENISNDSLHDLTVEDRLDTSLLSVLSAPGGEVTDNRITWHIPILFAGQSWMTNYSLEVMESDISAPLETTAYVFGDNIADMSSTKRYATSSVKIIQMLPPTGVQMPWGLGWISRLF